MTSPDTRFAAARVDRTRVVLEGFHAIKHAIRFGAELLDVLSPDPDAVTRLAATLAPDVVPVLERMTAAVPPAVFARVSGGEIATGVVAIASRPRHDAAAVFAAPAVAPVVFLDEPRHLGNLGAVIRVAAAAGAGGVVSTGTADPWHPITVRGAAGLQFALPVARAGELPATDRILIAVDPTGEVDLPPEIPDRAALLFGSERRGLSGAVLERAERRVRIPMRPGVSSLNLATAVAVMLYTPRGSC